MATRSARGSEVGEEIAFAGTVRQAELVRSGEVTPTELVELHLDRIERLDPRLNAFRIVLADRARAEAKQAEARLAAGEERPLLGVPIAIKDSVDLTGELTTHGTDAFPDPAREDSEMVKRLREAGAIAIGKTLLPEMAIHGFTESATFGVTRNPWNPQRSPGGSSGGSAAAVAAGLVPLATASDGGGSIRIPAASCGVFGLKPTRGRIPLHPDLMLDEEGGHWHGLSVYGCEARTVADSALFLDITSGGSHEAGAPAPPSIPFAESVRQQPGRLRVATSTKPVSGIVAPIVGEEVIIAVNDTGALLRSLGHAVEPRDPAWGPLSSNFTPRYLRGISDEIARAPHPERLERRTRGFARIGSLIPDSALRRARAMESEDRRRVLALFEDFDVLVTPVMGGTAIPVRKWEGMGAVRTLNGMSRFYPFCAPWNHLGCPAAAIPAGFAADGLPLSVQLIAPPGEEGRLLSLAAQLEAERPWADAKPPL